MSCIIRNSLFCSENITDIEFNELYKMIGGWYAYCITDNKKAKNYMMNAILDVIGYNVDVVTLKKQTLFQKIKKMIKLKRNGYRFMEHNGITIADVSNFRIRGFTSDLAKEVSDYKSLYIYSEFEKKHKCDEFENLDLPEMKIDINQKIEDLCVFGIGLSINNITEKHKFLVNNLKKLFYQCAKEAHPDNGGDFDDLGRLFITYQKLLKMRE